MSGISFNPENNSSQKVKKADVEIINMNTGAKSTIKADLGGFLTKGPQKDLENSIASSILSNTMPAEQSLNAKGFEKSYADMNGGQKYTNNVTGESVRVNTSWNNTGNKCYEYKRGNMQHSVIYDKNGRALGGDVQIKRNDGTIKIIKYEIDEKGNKVITSVSTEKLDSFMTHDGQY